MVKPSEVMILVLTVCTLLAVSACQGGSHSKRPKRIPGRNQTTPPSYDVYLPPTKLADLEDEAITESSGLAASRTSPGVIGPITTPATDHSFTHSIARGAVAGFGGLPVRLLMIGKTFQRGRDQSPTRVISTLATLAITPALGPR